MNKHHYRVFLTSVLIQQQRKRIHQIAKRILFKHKTRIAFAFQARPVQIANLSWAHTTQKFHSLSEKKSDGTHSKEPSFFQKEMSIPIQEFRTVPIRDDLRQKRENGDVILDADGKKFTAHSVILASQSAILANHIERQFEQQVTAKIFSQK